MTESNFSPESSLNIKLPPEVKTAIDLATRIAKSNLAEGMPGIEPTGENIEVEEVNRRFQVFPSDGTSLGLVDYLNLMLPELLQQLPKETQQSFLEAGVIKKDDGTFTWGESDSPEKRIALISALINHLQTGEIPDTGPIPTAVFLTGLQALAVEYARQIYEQAVGPDEVKITGRKRAPTDFLKMRISYAGTQEGAVFDTEKQIIYKVSQDAEVVNNEGKKVKFTDIVKPIAEAFTSGDFKTAVERALQFREQFTRLLEKNPDKKERVLYTLRKLINMTLTDTNISPEQKSTLQALLSANLEEPNNFQRALELIFNFNDLQADLQSDDEELRRRAKERFTNKILELGALVFGTEGLQRTVEVDLRMAVAFGDILLPPEARLQKIRLLQEANALREKMRGLRKQLSGEEEVKKPIEQIQLEALVTESKWKKVLSEFRELEQQQREAILYAFGAKNDKGEPIIDESKLTEEQKRLAEQIKVWWTELVTSGNDKVLEVNRLMITKILQSTGINLSENQIKVLNDFLSGKTKQSAGQVLETLGVNPKDEKYKLAEEIIKEGKRVERAINGLARRIQDDFSKVEELRLTGTVGEEAPELRGIRHNVLLMGLKGVEYMYRHMRFEPTQKTVTIKMPLELPTTVPIYKTVQTEKLLQSGAKKDKNMQATNEGQRKGKEGKGVSLKTLQQQLVAAKEELDTFYSRINKLASEIYNRGIGESSLNASNEMRKLGKNALIYTLPNGERIDLVSKLLEYEFEITTPSGETRKVRLSPEAILNSPNLARELMDELRHLEELKQKVRLLQQIEN